MKPTTKVHCHSDSFELKVSLVANGHPIQVDKSSTFVADLTSSKHPDM